MTQYKQEEIKPYSNKGDKETQVEAMFNNIAPKYDTLNHRLSWQIDRYWRKKAIKDLIAHHPQHILDIATGTGDFAILAAEMLKPESLTATDIAEGMMRIGQEKVNERNLSDIIHFERQDCTSLSYADNSFDAVTAAFGIRNFQNLEKGLEEMWRILKPGGRFCVLELTMPVKFPMRQLFHLYNKTVLPIYGRMISRDTSAYSYLSKSIEAFPQGEVMMDILKKIGFTHYEFKRLTFGICTLYTATK